MIIQPDQSVILASLSPRRRELLQKLGLKFNVYPPHIDETRKKGENIQTYVRRLAREKGEIIACQHPDSIVISADTIVLYRKQILGKPIDNQDAKRMLQLLSGRVHTVITAYAIHCKDSSLALLAQERTRVHFRKLNEEEINAYIETGSPLDKAGAYGIQDLSANVVRRINGCYYNVTGFPLPAFAEKWNTLFS